MYLTLCFQFTNFPKTAVVGKNTSGAADLVRLTQHHGDVTMLEFTQIQEFTHVGTVLVYYCYIVYCELSMQSLPTTVRQISS